LIIPCFMLLLAGCGREETSPLSEFEFFYSGKVVSMVDQRGQKQPSGIRSLYTLGLQGFKPEAHVFEKYRSMFGEDDHGYHFIEITKRTAIYKQAGIQRYPAKAEDIQTGQRVFFWISVHPKDEYRIEAKEITIWEGGPVDDWLELYEKQLESWRLPDD